MTHIDWLSTTCDLDEIVERSIRRNPGIEFEALIARFGGAWDALNDECEWSPTHSRAPFANCWTNGFGILVYSGPGVNYILVEFQAQGCAWIAARQLLIPCMESALARITRIDVAVDIQCDTAPEHITDRGYNQRFLSRTTIRSETGSTEYIGSLKADRFARVYRFAPPHPRANTLRVEFVNRRHLAKAVASRIIECDLTYVASALMIDYGINESFLKVDGEFIVVEYPPANKCSMVTEGWLIKQVAPCFKKLVKKGVIPSPSTWLEKHFLSE